MQDAHQNVNGDYSTNPNPPKDDFIRIADIGMSARNIRLRYPHIVIYGPADDPYVALADLEEGGIA